MDSLAAGLEDQHFFDLAASIIPIILFGSVLAKAFSPPGKDVEIKARHGIAAILLSVYITLMASAEILAIAAAVGGGANNGTRIAVAVALVVEIFGFGLAILVPWALRFQRDGKTHWLVATLLGIVLLGTFAWGSIVLMEFALEGSQGIDLQTRLGRVKNEAETDYLQWSRAARRAHSDHYISRLERHELALLRHRKLIAHEIEFKLLTH